jgi:1-deoxy-D-xylulose-5-phosphate reductoisomerase
VEPDPGLRPHSPARASSFSADQSVGTGSLDVIGRLPDRLCAVGLSAHSNWQQLFRQAAECNARWVAVTDPDAARAPTSYSSPANRVPLRPRRRCGDDHPSRSGCGGRAIVARPGCSAPECPGSGKTVALSNKETLVMAGPLVMDPARQPRRPGAAGGQRAQAIYQAMQAGPGR